MFIRRLPSSATYAVLISRASPPTAPEEGRLPCCCHQKVMLFSPMASNQPATRAKGEAAATSYPSISSRRHICVGAWLLKVLWSIRRAASSRGESCFARCRLLQRRRSNPSAMFERSAEGARGYVVVMVCVTLARGDAAHPRRLPAQARESLQSSTRKL